MVLDKCHGPLRLNDVKMASLLKVPSLRRFRTLVGVIIFMNFNEHSPPHFHAKYGEYQISVDIKTGVIEGKFPP